MKKEFITRPDEWEAKMRRSLDDLGQEVPEGWDGLWEYIREYLILEVIWQAINLWNASFVDTYFEHQIRLRELQKRKVLNFVTDVFTD